MSQPQLRMALNSFRRSYFSSLSIILVSPCFNFPSFLSISFSFLSLPPWQLFGLRDMQAERTQKKGGMVMCATVLLIMCFVMLVLLVIKEIILWSMVIFDSHFIIWSPLIRVTFLLTHHLLPARRKWHNQSLEKTKGAAKLYALDEETKLILLPFLLPRRM